MWRVALHQMRSSAGRLGAAALAIVLGSAFVATTLLAGATVEATTHNTMAAGYAEADLVIGSGGMSLDQVHELGQVDGVTAVNPVSRAFIDLHAGERSEWAMMGPVPSDARLSVPTLTDGALPEAEGQVAVVADLAQRLGAGLGDEITLTWEDPAGLDDGAEPTEHERTVQVVGLLEAPSSFFAMAQQVLTDAVTFEAWDRTGGAADRLHFTEAVVLMSGDADLAQVRTGLEESLPGVTVQTVTERAEDMAADFTGDGMLTALGLAFAAVALAVAALVIANTFTVLIAQRTRTLALLRCVGASRAQIRRSVLLEAAVLGLLAAAVALGLAVAVVAGGLNLLAGANDEVPLDTTVHLSPGIVAATLLTGLIVTVGACAIPARLATRVAPLAALQPVEGKPERRAGRARIALAIGSLVTGAALLAGALVLSVGAGEGSDAVFLALGIGVLGGLLSLLGLLIGAMFIVPALIRLNGRLLGRSVPARLATANAVRNPRRTGATASALMISVALVAMMSTGALTAQESLSRNLDERFGVDLTMSVGHNGAEPSRGQVQVLADHPDISETVLIEQAVVELRSARTGTETTQFVGAVAEGSLEQVVRDPDLAGGIPEGTVVLPHSHHDWYDLEDEDEVTITAQDGTEVSLRVHLSGIPGTALVSPEVLAELDESAQITTAWARFADGADEMDVVREVQTALTDLQAASPGNPTAWLGGSGVERAGYQEVISTLLAIVVALLGVSVVIALVGVANTLSLSVLERRRESATLRAMGLSRGRLRGMLAAEAVLISFAGAVIGIVAGVAYGWAGSTVMLSGLGDVTLMVPWRDLGLVLAGALAAGLAASVLPARSAVRDAPVVALAGP
ncbi:FtsX-like permease family protein [Pseudactinotalea sp. Z1732]|uniref:FtsX-like permease family protein n=1 Tax=Pseudactinotalea sp. Z1732 TaxID=3413026 RepID=UPI003C7CECDD